MSSSYRQLVNNHYTDNTAATSSSSTTLLGGDNTQPILYKGTFDATQKGRQIRISGRGVVGGTTGNPTITFAIAMGSSAASLGGAVLGISPAIQIVTGGVTNAYFEFVLNVIFTTPGIGSSNATATCSGTIRSPGGFASPFEYSLIPSQGSQATWTQTFDSSVDNYIQVYATWSGTNAANTITLKHLEVEALN